MNAQQARFVQEYIKDPSSATKAAERAGYSSTSAGNQAHRLMKDDEILSAIQAHTIRVGRDEEITAERIQREILHIADDPDVPVKDRLRAWELLGKTKALFADRQINEGQRSVRVVWGGRDAE